LTNNEIVAVKILNLEAQMAPLEDIVHEAQTMKVWSLELSCCCVLTFCMTAVVCVSRELLILCLPLLLLCVAS
jgi:hypothetical protein